jgi:hypothetical protein
VTTPPTDHLSEVEVRIPDFVLDAEISARAVRLYGVLCLHPEQRPSRQILADYLRAKTLHTVDKALRELDSIGALRELPPPAPRPVATHPEAARRRNANRRIQKAFRRIGERDGFRCRTCGLDRTLTVDHVIAVINGGTDDDDNLQILCRSHNTAKGAR